MKVKACIVILAGGCGLLAAGAGFGAEHNQAARVPAARTAQKQAETAAPIAGWSSAAMPARTTTGAAGQDPAPPAQPPAARALMSSIGILPEFKRGERVNEEERNPYANRIVEKEKPAESGSEAAKIIKILETLQVRGICRDVAGNVKTVLLGDLPLTQGRDVPQLLPSQVDQIFVSKVDRNEVEITWRTDAGKTVPDGRRLVLKMDDRPRVEIVLPGQPDVKEEDRLRALLVAKPDEQEGR